MPNLTPELWIEILKESAWWLRFVAWNAAHRERRRARGMSADLSDEDCVHAWREDQSSISSYETDAQPLVLELRALCEEIKSGAIYGSKGHCAVCGCAASSRGFRGPWREFACGVKTGARTEVQCCSIEHWPTRIAADSGYLPAAGAILRARKALGLDQRNGLATSALKVFGPPETRPSPEWRPKVIRTIRRVTCTIASISWTNNDRGAIFLYDEGGGVVGGALRVTLCAVGGDSSRPVNLLFTGPVRLEGDFMPTVRGIDLEGGTCWTAEPERICEACVGDLGCGSSPSPTCRYYPRLPGTAPKPTKPPVVTITPAVCWQRDCLALTDEKDPIVVDGHAFCKEHGEAARKWYEEQDRLAERASQELNRPVWKGFRRMVQTGDLHGPTLDPRRQRR